MLGAAAVALYPIQGYVIPKLQRKVNQLGKRRVRTMRQVADRVQEIGRRHRRDPGQRHGQAAADRFRAPAGHASTTSGSRSISANFSSSFSTTSSAQLTPFFFYSIGGYLVITRQPVVRRAGRGAGRLQGSGLAVEGAARLLPDQGEFADHLRPDRRAVPARRHDRCRAAAGRAGDDPARSPASWRSPICRSPRTTRAGVVDAVSFTLGARRACRGHRPERQRQERAGAAAGAAGAADQRPDHDRRHRPRRVAGRRRSAGASAMSARRRICSPARCATICCSACGTARCGRPTMTRSAAQTGAPASSIEARRSGNIDFDIARRLDRLRERRGRRRRRS